MFRVEDGGGATLDEGGYLAVEAPCLRDEDECGCRLEGVRAGLSEEGGFHAGVRDDEDWGRGAEGV